MLSPGIKARTLIRREVHRTMSFGIYKQGQGYWVRVLTAGFLGVLIISAAAWGWKQAEIVRLPARDWTLSLSNVHGQVQPGDQVTFEYYNTDEGLAESLSTLGVARIVSYSEGKGSTGNLVVDAFGNEKLRQRASDAVNVFVGDPQSPSMTAQVRGGTATPVFPIEYLQSGIAGGIMLLGAISLYIFVGSHRKAVEFLVATDGEMKKVNWTSYKEVKGSTIVVIVATFLIAGFLFGVDTIFAKVFTAIGVLQK